MHSHSSFSSSLFTSQTPSKFSLTVAAKMVIRDSRGKVNTSNSWNSQIITRANSGSDIRLGGHVDISGRGGEGGGGEWGVDQ